MSKSALVFSLLLGGVVLTSCGSAPSNQMTSDQAAMPAATPAAEEAKETASVPRQRSQLIKKAAMTVIVDSVDKSVDAVSQIIKKQQGDLINLEEKQPQEDNARHTASIQMRVPQNLLDVTLDELGKLGTVQNRNITAQDVGSQLVDFQARLINLRATETNLQKIMDRAGSVRDVLSVAKELSNVRESIEQINAQLKSLQNQVAYSTITLNLEATVSSSNQGRSLGVQIQETWNKSTHSLGDFTVGLLRLGIWLMVYSPFLLLIAGGVYGFKRWRRSNIRHAVQTPEPGNQE
jgi:Domain of unknown function (DUF4349)